MRAIPHDQVNFLASKIKFSTHLAGASSKQEFKKKLLETLSQIDNDEESTYEESQSAFQQNEDDCYGINLSQFQ